MNPDMTNRWNDDFVLIPLICKNCMWDKFSAGICDQCGGTEKVKAASLLKGR